MENKQKKLEILVVEDSAIHQNAAKVLLSEHNTTIVSTFDEAIDLLIDKKAYDVLDVLLTDLFYTQGKGVMQADKSQANVELPFGYPLAMIAAKKKVPYIAVLTDANHHSSPMAYTVDHLFDGDAKMSKNIMKMNGSKVAVLNSWHISPLLYQTPDGKIGTKEQIGQSFIDVDSHKKCYEVPDDAVDVKNWKAALDIVTGNYNE